MVSESPIWIIRYSTDIAHIVSEKTFGYQKIISESLFDPSRSFGRSGNIRTIYIPTWYHFVTRWGHLSRTKHKSHSSFHISIFAALQHSSRKSYKSYRDICCSSYFYYKLINTLSLIISRWLFLIHNFCYVSTCILCLVA